VFDTDDANQRQSGRRVTVSDALRHGIQSSACHFVESFTGRGKALLATPVPFGNEDDVLVAPCGDGAALDPGSGCGFSLCSPSCEGVYCD
jgi:hypothetical protein